jgi:hypothetical protein
MAKSIVLLAIIMMAAIWFIVRPGLYIISPMPGFEDGTMLFYYDRNPNIPFFYSTDLQCLRSLGERSEDCRLGAYESAGGVRDRTLFQVPFSKWAHTRSLEKQP